MTTWTISSFRTHGCLFLVRAEDGWFILLDLGAGFAEILNRVPKDRQVVAEVMAHTLCYALNLPLVTLP